jgi:amidase
MMFGYKERRKREDPTSLKLAELIEREFGGFVPPKMFDD